MIWSHNDYWCDKIYYTAVEKDSECVMFEYDLCSTLFGKLYLAHQFKFPWKRKKCYKDLEKVKNLVSVSNNCENLKYIYLEIKTGNTKATHEIYMLVASFLKDSEELVVIIGGDDYHVFSKIFQRRRKLRDSIIKLFEFDSRVCSIEDFEKEFCPIRKDFY